MWQKLTKGAFLEGPEQFWHPKSRSKISNLSWSLAKRPVTICCIGAFIHEVLGLYTSVFKYWSTKLHFIVDNNSNAKCDNSFRTWVSVWRWQFFWWLAAKETDTRDIRLVRRLTHHRYMNFYTYNVIMQTIFWNILVLIMAYNGLKQTN